MKLTKKDIKILHPGLQIEKAITDKYGSLEEFAKATGYSIKSLYRYCHNRPFGTEQFRTKLLIILNKSYGEVFVSPEKQIDNHIDFIWSKIEEYQYSEDLELIEHVINLCKNKDFKVALTKAYRIKAMYYYYQNQLSQAIVCIQLASNMLPDSASINLRLNYYSNLVMLYTRSIEYTKAKEVLQIIERIISENGKIDDNEMFNFYYRSGVLYGKSDSIKAKESFEKALQFAKRNRDICSIYLVIGLAYKRLRDYEKAKEYYELCIAKLELPDIKILNMVYNNMAHMYYEMESVDDAIKYAEMAYSVIPENDFDKRFNSFLTYNRFIGLKNKTNAFENMLNYFDRNNHLVKNKTIIIGMINEIITYAKEVNEIQKLKALVSSITKLVKCSSDNEYCLNLRACIGDIHILLNGGDNE